MFHADGLRAGDLDVLQLIVGGLLFWLPGIAWTWASVPRLAVVQKLPLSLVAAFTIQPAAMLLLNLVVRVPITLSTTSLLSGFLALAGFSVFLRRRLADAGLS